MSRDTELANFNEMYTPDIALEYIKEFLPKDKIYWEACYGLGHLARALEVRGLKVIGNKDIDCLLSEPEEDWDIWFTNPPFKGNKKFVRRAIELGKPFIFLLRLEHIGGVDAMEVFDNDDIQIIIPENRINYITPKIMRGEKTGGATFHSIFICYKMNLPKKIIYKSLTTECKRYS